MKRDNTYDIVSTCRRIPLMLTRALLIVLAVNVPALAHPAAVVDDPRLAEAHRLFHEASYDSALVLLDRMAGDEALSQKDRLETYRLQGLIYTLKDDEASARRAIRRSIELNPNAVVADPDHDMMSYVRLYYKERKAYNEEHYCPAGFQPPDPCQYTMERPDPGIRTVAIIDFDNNAIIDRALLDPLREGLPDLMIRLLNGQTGLQIVERERLDWLLEEIDLNQHDKIDEQTAIRAGKLMGAHAVLLGDFMYLNDTFTLGARLVKVETGQVLLVAEEEGRLKHFSKIAGKLSEELAREILPNVERGEWEGRSPTQDLGAMLAYAEGLSLLDEGDAQGAADKFEETLALDAHHEAARLRFNALRPQIASADRGGR